MTIRTFVTVIAIVVVTFMASTSYASELHVDDQTRIAQAACEIENGSSITWQNAETGEFFFCTAVGSTEVEYTDDADMIQTRVMDVSTMTADGITEPVRYYVILTIGGFGANAIEVIRAN